MDNTIIERIFISGVKLGTIQTLTELNMLEEKLLVPKAEKKYGKDLIRLWYNNEWIKFYPTGNKKRGKYYVLKSECERARLMLSFGNTIPQNIVDRHL